MNLSRLEELKEKLVTANDLSTVAKFFFDHFGENEAFLDLGGPTTNSALESFIPAIARELCGGKCVVTHMLLIEVPDTHFIHGGCMINGRMGNVIYFDDIQTGLLALTAAKPGGNTLFGRFSAQALPPEAVPPKN